MKKLQNNNFIIQIQHLLKLNFSSWTPDNGYPSIQIQHLLKLNFKNEKEAKYLLKFKYNTC